MLLKQEQGNWLKIESARSRNAQHWHQEARDACGASILFCRTVASWNRALREGRKNVPDVPWYGHPPISGKDVRTVPTLVETDRNFTICELALDIELAPSTLLHIP